MLHTISEMSVFGNTVRLQKETGYGIPEYIVGVSYPDVNRCGELSRSYEYLDALANYEHEVKECILRELHRYKRIEQAEELGVPKNQE